ncbi:MAG: aconitase family protein, partial [Steroidobacteraceae bacterium]
MQPNDAKTMLQKIWEQHEVVPESPDTPAVLYIDRHLIHEVTSPQAFTTLRQRGLSLRRPELTFATIDHSNPTRTEQIFGGVPISIESAAQQISQLERNCAEFGVELLGLTNPMRGIVHVIGPELGLTLPGCTLVCG